MIATAIVGLTVAWLGWIPEPTLAVYDGGTVRVADVIRERRFASPSELKFRAATGVSESRTWSEWTQRQALRDIAIATSDRMGVASRPEIQADVWQR